jgi:hypothetical protein
MKKSIVIFIIAIIALFSCKQGKKSTPETVKRETINSIRKYEYADSMGNRLIIHNSFPKGDGYTDSNGKEYLKVIFWTRITNETVNPIELKIDFPADSFRLSSSPDRYLKILIPSDTMTIDEEPLYDYGMTGLKSFLDNNINKPSSLKRTINPKESTAFYVVILSNKGKGVDGILRTGFNLKGQNLVYKLSAYKSTPEHPLMEEKEINCGSINLKNLIYRIQVF